MSSQLTIEQRLLVLEETVANMQRQMGITQPSINWVEQFAGSMKDEEAFREAMDFARAYRQADQPVEEVDCA